MPLSKITSSNIEPLTLTEAKDHLRVDFTKEDALISRLIVAAREAFEDDTPRQLLTATWKQFFDGFPQFDHERIRIAKPPLVSVAAVSYFDTSGVLQTWPAAEYTVEAFSGPKAERGVLFPKPDEEYPQTRRIPNAVTIDFDAGYGVLASDVPFEIKEALLAWIGHHYNNRELVIVGQTAARVPMLGFEPWQDADFG
ncbi:MAG: head-tail connector protein [Gammaproteobacteria bacterium]